MRLVQNAQMKIGEVDISQIQFDPKSRDDIPKILKGLQHLYMNIPLREQIFKLLEEEISPGVSKRNGRPGMALWKILVCGVVRLDLNEGYDRLHELVNHHNTLREVLGHASFDEEMYQYQTLVDNVSLFTPELLDKINQVVVSGGHALIKKKKAKRCVGGATPLWLGRTCITRPTSTCCLMRCAKQETQQSEIGRAEEEKRNADCKSASGIPGHSRALSEQSTRYGCQARTTGLHRRTRYCKETGN